MTAPTNLSTTLNVTGNREDLEDTIYRVAPEKTPFLSAIGKKKASARYHEWQTENLATPNPANAALEGDDVATLDAPNNTTRVGNYCQIFRKTLGVSRTQEVVDKAGRKSEVNRQKVRKGIELRRDMEARMIGNYASVAEAGATPRGTAGVLAWLTSNVSRGASGASGGFATGVVAAATPGTQRTFTEAMLKAAWASAFANGANPSIAFMGPVQKQQFSAFTGIAGIRTDVKGREQATIIAGAEVYVGDFGQLMLVPHPYGLTRDLVAIDPEYASVATLDGFKTEDLAKTGDSQKQIMTHEAAFECANEKAHFVIADLQ
ncbi:MAG TPA: DUF5309 domain-containing protein [Phenylobacterium sp.]|uniref:DUF5309 domain-containing protein n=1 Tax=Phenylobacterium sp. TaxID=1871053 RepID=UPI002B462785|nr:DUF5309 domain-containing protein [Phenylobacterium sp.]HKR87023.1 DUF5309 domain-containing protein [Phenylobacterium sp.]